MKSYNLVSIFLLLLIALSLLGCQESIRGNGKVIEKDYLTDEFRSLEIAGTFDVILRQGDRPNLRIRLDENLVDYIDAHVNGDKLTVEMTERIKNYKAMQLDITVTDLRNIDFQGAIEVETAERLELNDLKIRFQGAADGDLHLIVDDLDLSVDGAADLQLTGRATEFKLKCDGTSTVRAQDLVAQDVKVKISGAAEAEVHAVSNLDVNISGTGTVAYLGTPKVTKKISGTGVLRRLGLPEAQ